MALINHAKREINAKIVYFGREGVGKYTTLRYIFDRLKASLRGEFKSLSTQGDSLQFFDFSPFETPMFGGYRIRFHVYTLSGKVNNPAAWKMILKSADGLVLVADAHQYSLLDELSCVAQLRDYVGTYGISLHDMDMVLQLNGDGAVSCSLAETARALGLADVTSCYAIPERGDGVLEVLSQLSRKIMTRIGNDPALHPVDNSNNSADVSETLSNDESQGSEQPLVDVELLPEEQLPDILPESESYIAEPHPNMAGSKISIQLAGDPASYAQGMLRIPLTLAVAGETRRMILSVSLTEA